MELHFADVFESVADAFADEVALCHGTGASVATTSWSEYDQSAARVAGWLAARGVGVGSGVGLLLYNGPEYLIAQFAAFKVRAVPININYRYQPREIGYVADNADLDVVFVSASLVDRIGPAADMATRVRHWIVVPDGAQPAVAPGLEQHPSANVAAWTEVVAGPPVERIPRSADDHYVLYTGGTTGMPKGVVFRMGDFVSRMFTGYAYRGWTPPKDAADVVVQARAHALAGDRRVSVVGCPLMHGTGMWLGAFYAHLMGGTTVTLSGSGFNADALWATVAAQRADAVTIVGDSFGVPMLAALDRAAAAGEPYDLESLRVIQSSGVMFSAETQRGLLRYADVRIVDSMGSTEGGMARRIATRATPIETATFELIPGTRLVTDDGRFVEPGSGDVGRIAASAVVPLGYYKDAEKSAATFVTIEGVRYAMAGDYATLTADNRLVLLGRGSNCINTGGEKVFPEEVEESLKRHPDVVDALVIGVEDPGGFGQRVAAVVCLRTDASLTEDELRSHVRSELAGYKVPRAIALRPAIQRSASGKADYRWASEQLLG